MKKYNKGQVFYKGKAVSPAQTIASVYSHKGLWTCNFDGVGAGSYPLCKKVRGKDELIINNGDKCDKIKLWQE